MKANKIFKQFINENENLKTIAKMVVNQMGGINADTLRELESVRNAADGFSGFIYYTDTTKFWAKVRRYALPYMEELADGIGESCVLSMVKNFNSFKKGDYTESEIAISLYGSLTKSNAYIDNVLAWFCLEEVAYRFGEFIYESEIELAEVED